MAWRRLPGRARQYQDTATGVVISDRQFRKLGNPARAPSRPLVRTLDKRELPPSALPVRASIRPVEYDRLKITQRANARYHQLVSDYVKAEAEKGRQVGLQEARRSQGLRNIQALLSARRKDGKQHIPKVKKALKMLGRRDGIPEHVRPGESHKRFKRDPVTGKWTPK